MSDTRVRDQPQIKTRIRQSDYDAVKKEARREHRSVSAQVALIVERWVKDKPGREHVEPPQPWPKPPAKEGEGG